MQGKLVVQGSGYVIGGLVVHRMTRGGWLAGDRSLTLPTPADRLRGPVRWSANRGRREARRLAEVRVGENETFESALRRFNKKIQQSGILAEARRREHYEKPSVKRKRKEAKKRKGPRF